MLCCVLLIGESSVLEILYLILLNMFSLLVFVFPKTENVTLACTKMMPGLEIASGFLRIGHRHS
jgi:hypothetical protein